MPHLVAASPFKMLRSFVLSCSKTERSGFFQMFCISHQSYNVDCNMYMISIGCFFKFHLVVGVGESSVNAPLV
jgi:Rps23 Pro-64 3,4-dihydroxylase Tpa1-like proline 4-hydroxylase